MAVDSVDFDVRVGEIHALVGENGAGKSTLIKILGGVYLPDGGRIILDGKEVVFSSTHQSLENRISVIYQEFNLVPDLSVAENIFIGREPKAALGTLIDFRRLNARAAEILATLDMPLNVKSFVADISVAERQMVEIAKALSHDSRLIIMDEPTATLTEKEVRKIFEIVKNLRARGVSIIYISHRLEEAFELADRITVMRDGRKVGTKPIAETNKSEIIEMMVGKVVMDYFAKAGAHAEHPGAPPRGQELLRGGRRGGCQLHAVQGRDPRPRRDPRAPACTACCSPFSASSRKKAGRFSSRAARSPSIVPADAIRLGIGYVTEDRKNAGLLPAMSVLHNLTIIIIRALSFLRGLFIRDREETRSFERIRTTLDIKLAGPGQRIIYLERRQPAEGAHRADSSHRLQGPHPPGADPGHRRRGQGGDPRILRQLADKGLSVILTSSELPELVNLPDRCIVLYKGRKAAEFDRETMDSEKLVAAQIGQSAGTDGARP